MDDLSRGAAKLTSGGGDGGREATDYRPLASGELADAWELGEFFEALGPVMRLAPKDAEPAAATPRAGSRGGARRRTALLVGLAVALVAGAAGIPALLSALQPDEPVPAGLHGRWVTTSERYADRSFELSETTLRLGLAQRDMAYPIVGVRRRDSAGATLYAIRYRDAENVLELGVVIGADSVSRLRNLADVSWTKVPR